MLGHTEDGREFSLAVRGRNVLIMGETNSGKSWLAGLLCERLILHGYSLCVIDPEGDYRTLDALPGVRVLGVEDDPPTPRALLHALRYSDRSVVIDLSCMEHKPSASTSVQCCRLSTSCDAARARRTASSSMKDTISFGMP